MATERYIPALGFRALTRYYDPLLPIFMRELQWQFQQKASLEPAAEERARQILRQTTIQ